MSLEHLEGTLVADFTLHVRRRFARNDEMQLNTPQLETRIPLKKEPNNLTKKIQQDFVRHRCLRTARVEPKTLFHNGELAAGERFGTVSFVKVASTFIFF
ncbi:hypothetical protein AVEN_239217-1 [Araneus ventricosus]|uniref:Uncharacterized protein n=1 Tax=Araneus ventricosus TaxID=182803 RepID=A0A4Y2JMG1_ARAVE|nr:hypothetical protein AVEN_239217-1 [Araneus ventricosus]